MEASIINLKTLNAGVVSLITGIKNPISLAKEAMMKSKHAFLADEVAMQFAKANAYKIEDKTYFHDELRHQQWL